MRTIKNYVVFTVAFMAIFALSSFVSRSNVESATEVQTEVHAHLHGKYCTGSVGCSCPGFSPITNGDEWQKAYCKHCGHKRSCHK